MFDGCSRPLHIVGNSALCRAESERLRAQLAEAERGQVAAAERQSGERQAVEALQADVARAQARLASAQRDVAAQRAAAEALEAELQDVKAQRDHAAGVRTLIVCWAITMEAKGKGGSVRQLWGCNMLSLLVG